MEIMFHFRHIYYKNARPLSPRKNTTVSHYKETSIQVPIFWGFIAYQSTALADVSCTIYFIILPTCGNVVLSSKMDKCSHSFHFSVQSTQNVQQELNHEVNCTFRILTFVKTDCPQLNNSFEVICSYKNARIIAISKEKD